jgi:hypothetical protein
MISRRVSQDALPCLLFALLVGVSVAASAPANQCDNTLQPIAGDLGYVWRGGRCEGLYTSLVAASSLELVSLLKGKLHFNPQPDLRLEASAPNVSAMVRGPIRVRVVALPLKTYYRMDAVLPASHRMTWAGEVLHELELYAHMIGAFGWVEVGTQKVFVPLQVGQQGASLPQAAVEMMVRSPVAVETLKWRASVVGQRGATPSPWLDAVTSPVPAGQPVAIALPGGAPAMLHIEVAAKEQNTTKWSRLEIQVIRP